MAQNENYLEKLETLRQRAEEIERREAALAPKSRESLSPEEIRQTLHGLRVHQIQLEMQNEELQRTQMELEVSRARYFDLYDMAPIGYCTVSEKGMILEANFMVADLLGVTRKAVTSVPFSRFIYKEDQDIYYLLLRKLYKTREPQVCELRLTDQAGDSFWVNLQTAIVLDENGAAVSRMVLSDITNRKLTALYGEMGREVLQILNESGDLQNSIERVLTLMKKMTGFDAVGIRLQKEDDFPYISEMGFPQDFLLSENSLVERSADGGMCQGIDGKIALSCFCGLVISGQTDPSNPFFTPGGSFWTNESSRLLNIPSTWDRGLNPRNKCIDQGYLSVALVPIRMKEHNVGLIQFNDRHKGCFSLETVQLLEGIASHIGAALMRKKAEAALQLVHRQNQEILNSITDAFISLTNSMTITYFNSAAERILGRDHSEVIGRNLLDVFPEVKDSIFEDKFTQVLQTKSPMSFEVEFASSPCQSWYDVRVYPSLEGITIYFQVITERKRAEEEKAKLESVNRQLQKAESLGRMAGAIAHHFNNKLHVVKGYLELVFYRLPPGDISLDLSAAMQAADKAAEVSKMMLSYLGQVTGKREVLDLSEISRKGLSLIEAAFPKNVVLKTDLPRPGPAVDANASQIQQVLTNLVTNAWEAAGDNQGLIHLTVSTVPSVDISTSHRFPVNWRSDNINYACLEVRDNGCGIAEKDLEEIFSPFFSTKFTGRGLGLSVVHGLVQAHGGVVIAKSSPGQGSAFRVFLPLSAEKIDQQPLKEIKAFQSQETGKVLLVDDDRVVLEITSMMLSTMGFTVLRATDGIEAMEVFRQHQNEIRFVLSDVAMPRMNGWETLAALRKIQPGIPVILASGYSEEQVMAENHSERPHLFLAKPYNLKELKDAICKLPMKKAE